MTIGWKRENLSPAYRMWADGVNALHEAKIFFDPNAPKQEPCFALIELKSPAENSAQKILEEIRRDGVSENPIARAVVDEKLGGVFADDKGHLFIVAAGAMAEAHAAVTLKRAPGVERVLHYSAPILG